MARKQQSSVDRRTFMKLTGASFAAAAVGAGATSGSVAAASTADVSDGDYLDDHFRAVGDGETLVIPRGTYKLNGATVRADNWRIVAPEGATIVPSGFAQIDLHGHGWEFGGFRFDMQGSRTVRVNPHGGAYSLRNCAWDGKNTTDLELIYPYLEADTTAEIRNCWFGGGCWPGNSVDLPREVRGDLWFRNCYFYQSGSYSTPSARVNQRKHTGTVNFEGCYFENCYNAAIRTGQNHGKKCVVKDSVIVFDSREETPAWDESGAKPFRGIWAFWGDVDVVNTHITNPWGHCILAKSGSYHAAGTVRAIDCQLDGSVDSDVQVVNSGANPRTEPPASCVTSVEEAISGEAGAVQPDPEPAEPTLPNSLTVRGTDNGRVANYTLTVTDTVEAFDVDSEDAATGATAKGAVAGGADEYRFGGELDTISLDGPAEVYVNGTRVDPEEYGDNTLPNVVEIRGTSGYANYEFGVSGEIQHHTADGATVNNEDAISGATAEGAVAGGADSYAFSGEITAFTFVEGTADVTVNGKAFAPSEIDPVPESGALPHRFVIDGSASSGITEYTFGVSGDLEAAEYGGATVDREDAVADGRVTGAVAGGKDAYRFSGTIQAFDITGKAALELEYNVE